MLGMSAVLLSTLHQVGYFLQSTEILQKFDGQPYATIHRAFSGLRHKLTGLDPGLCPAVVEVAEVESAVARTRPAPQFSFASET